MPSIRPPKIIFRKSMKRRIISLMRIFLHLKLLSKQILPARKLDTLLRKNPQSQLGQPQEFIVLSSQVQGMDQTLIEDQISMMTADQENLLPLKFWSRRKESLKRAKVNMFHSSNTTTINSRQSTKDGQLNKFLLSLNFCGRRKREAQKA